VGFKIQFLSKVIIMPCSFGKKILGWQFKIEASKVLPHLPLPRMKIGFALSLTEKYLI